MENPAEVQELRNKLRMMKFPQDEILNTVRRQQRAIHKQKEANDTLRSEIQEFETQIESIQKDLERHQSSEELQRLQAQQKALANKLSTLSADRSVEDNKRKKLEEEISRAESNSGGLFKQLRANEDLQARVRTMENRLDKALVRYNENLKTLAQLREQLDELRKDRRNFREAMSTSSATLLAKDAYIAELIAESNKAYEKRDKRKMALAQLRETEKTDVKLWEEQVKNVEQTIEAQKLSQNRPIDQRPTETLESQTSQSDQQEELTSQTEQCQSTIQRILELCGAKDVPALFEDAEVLERENFSLYTYVVEHGARKTRLQEEIEGLQLQKEALELQIAQRDVDESSALQRLTDEIVKVGAELAEMSKTKEDTAAEFAALYREIDSLFNTLGCSWDDAPDGKTTPTAANSMFCLSAIEGKISTLVGTIFDKTKTECMVRDVKPASFLPEDRPDSQSVGSNKHASGGVKPPDKEVSAKLAESTRPLSIEELRRLLE
jgi:chromosome segregation ATPase